MNSILGHLNQLGQTAETATVDPQIRYVEFIEENRILGPTNTNKHIKKLKNYYKLRTPVHRYPVFNEDMWGGGGGCSLGQSAAWALGENLGKRVVMKCSPCLSL